MHLGSASGGSDVYMDLENILLEYTPKTPATPDLHLASLGLAVAPCPSHTTALRFVGESTGAVNDSASGDLAGKGVLTLRICG